MVVEPLRHADVIDAEGSNHPRTPTPRGSLLAYRTGQSANCGPYCRRLRQKRRVGVRPYSSVTASELDHQRVMPVQRRWQRRGPLGPPCHSADRHRSAPDDTLLAHAGVSNKEPNAPLGSRIRAHQTSRSAWQRQADLTERPGAPKARALAKLRYSPLTTTSVSPWRGGRRAPAGGRGLRGTPAGVCYPRPASGGWNGFSARTPEYSCPGLRSSEYSAVQPISAALRTIIASQNEIPVR